MHVYNKYGKRMNKYVNLVYKLKAHLLKRLKFKQLISMAYICGIIRKTTDDKVLKNKTLFLVWKGSNLMQKTTPL